MSSLNATGQITEPKNSADPSEVDRTHYYKYKDFSKGMAMAERIESGIVHINDQTVHDEPQVPFGGVKDRGWGRFGGRAALEEFTELRWVSAQLTLRQYPF